MVNFCMKECELMKGNYTFGLLAVIKELIYLYLKKSLIIHRKIMFNKCLSFIMFNKCLIKTRLNFTPVF